MDKEVIEQVPISYEEAKEWFERLFEQKIAPDEARKRLIAMAQRQETADEIAAAAEVMQRHAVPLPISESLRERLIDNCGTGGDRSGSFNISTTASLVLASMDCHVAKHGNRSITSRSGSADLLEALGVRLDLSPQQQAKMLMECGFVFMFAMNHHPAMQFIMPIRRTIPHRTIFNLLGPLTNPAGVSKQLIGVFDRAFVPKITQALQKLKRSQVMVVSARDGLDEISISAPTEGMVLQGSECRSIWIDPEKMGMKLAEKAAIMGGDAEENAKITYAILEGKERGPKRDVVLLNVAGALIVEGRTDDWNEAIAMAAEAIDSKKALRKLKEIIKVSQSL